MNNYEFYKRIGICTTCRKNAAAPGHTKCPECLRKKREYNKTYKAAKKEITDPELLEILAKKRAGYQRKYREKHKRLGICVDCSKPATHGNYCEKHWLYKKQYNYNHYETHKNIRDKLETPKLNTRSKVDIGKLISLHNAGWKNSDIAIEMKISRSTVIKFLKLAREQMEEKNELQS